MRFISYLTGKLALSRVEVRTRTLERIDTIDIITPQASILHNVLYVLPLGIVGSYYAVVQVVVDALDDLSDCLRLILVLFER